MPKRKGAARSGLEVTLKSLRDGFLSERKINHDLPRFEFVRVNRFSGVVFGETLP